MDGPEEQPADCGGEYELTVAPPALLPKHAHDLERSGLSPETIAAAGVYSESDPDAVAALLGLETPNPSLVPALMFPYPTADGAPPDYHRVKPDRPRTGANDRPVKYEAPRGRGNRLYVPPDAREAVEAAGASLLITEGEKKALKATQEGFACLGLSGVWNFKNRDLEDLIADLRAIDWRGRVVYIVFDADSRTNQSVRLARARFAERLTAAGAIVRIVDLPALPRKPKAGVDDYLIANGPDALRDLLQAACPPETPERAARRPAKGIDPEELAAGVIERTARGGVSTIRFVNGCWYRWSGSHYELLGEKSVQNFVLREIKREAENIKRDHVANVVMHLQEQCEIPGEVAPGTWLIDPPVDWRPRDVIAAANGLVHVPSLSTDSPLILPHTPGLFLTASSPIPYDPAAPRPDEWLRFLHEDLFPGRPEEVRLFRQWAGYQTTPDVSLQKMMLLVGPTRSGKGTILRVLRDLNGPSNVAAVTLKKLGSPFGLSPLLGKSALLLGDVRVSSARDRSAVVEHLLSIVGQDVMTVDRKNQSMVTGPLPLKVSAASNENIVLPDASGALAARFLPLRFIHSFADNPDTELYDRLREELPGILLWAAGGLADLRTAGRFHEPAETVRLRDEMAELCSPVKAFLRDRCECRPDGEVPTDRLREEYAQWCQSRGTAVPDAAQFGRELRAAAPQIDVGQSRKYGNGRPVSVYRGVALLAA